MTVTLSNDEQISAGGPMYHYQYRLIVIGDSTVGKSSLLKYFTEGRRAEISDPTVGVDFYARMLEPRPDLRIKLQLWDTAGQEKFRSITRSYYRNSVGVIVVYDISNHLTFDHVMDWLNEAEANVGGPCPSSCVFQLIGHKADLESERQVMYEEGEFLAKYHKIKFIETSAITGDNIQEAFLMIAREITKRLEDGELKISDGWEGIKSGMSPAKAVSLTDTEAPISKCYC
uniref:Ras-related protein Rab-39B n=1 Tax=Syphacia muris TaxID=451379 RepID=A0A0N5AHP0_9BILA